MYYVVQVCKFYGPKIEILQHRRKRRTVGKIAPHMNLELHMASLFLASSVPEPYILELTENRESN
jgi:hypothetical protein